MGCYVFSRLDDMFQFFRTDRNHKDEGLHINPGYWSEKLQAVDGNREDGTVLEFDHSLFDHVIICDYLIPWIREKRDVTTKEERRDLWETVMFDVIGADEDSRGHRKQIAAHDFSHHVNSDVGNFEFHYLFDHTFKQYTLRFLWCCYALAWGIQKYDNRQGTPPA